MDNTVVIALCSLVGTLGGSVLGILTANKLVVYRLEQIEKRMEIYSDLLERIVVIEQAQSGFQTELLEMWKFVKEFMKGGE